MQLVVNLFYMMVGIVFLLLSRVRNILRGYSPKPFTTSEWARSANYDITVVDNWLCHLTAYATTSSVMNKSILELGPGSDLGTGLYLLSKQASQYVAIDVNNMAPHAPRELYEALFNLIAARGQVDIDSLRQELRMAQDGRGRRLRFVLSPEFDLSSSVPRGSIDLVFSQAAFEHFDDIDAFLRHLEVVTRPGAILIAEVDLCTHSRWIRDKDELNIYRYSDWIYNLLRFSGSPNRVRPYQYRDALERFGWTKIQIKPLRTLSNERFSAVRQSLAKRFRGDHNQMEQLSITFCATRKSGAGT